MRKSAFWAAVLGCACSGPPAPDTALCEDVITRLCFARGCPGVEAALSPGAACLDGLLERTGCAAEDFTFREPSRERVLFCRQPLVRRTTSPNEAPTCAEVAEVQRDCPDLMDFLGGRLP